nr:hypothetical protein CFP56_08032 [Quercus suber]
MEMMTERSRKGGRGAMRRMKKQRKGPKRQELSHQCMAEALLRCSLRGSSDKRAFPKLMRVLELSSDFTPFVPVQYTRPSCQCSGVEQTSPVHVEGGKA